MNNLFSLALYAGRQNSEKPEEEGEPQSKGKGGSEPLSMTITPLSVDPN